MSRALLALVLALSLGNSAALSWMDALVRLASDAVGQGAPAGSGAESDYGSKWDPNG